jgi:hypothetical protein
LVQEGEDEELEAVLADVLASDSSTGEAGKPDEKWITQVLGLAIEAYRLISQLVGPAIGY